jgi:hypothetical protein
MDNEEYLEEVYHPFGLEKIFHSHAQTLITYMGMNSLRFSKGIFNKVDSI